MLHCSCATSFALAPALLLFFAASPCLFRCSISLSRYFRSVFLLPGEKFCSSTSRRGHTQVVPAVDPHLARPAAPSRTIQPASVLTRTGQPDPRHICTLAVALSRCPHTHDSSHHGTCMIGPLALSSCTATVLAHGPVLGPALPHRHPSCPAAPQTGTSRTPFGTPGSAAPLLHSPAPLYA